MSLNTTTPQRTVHSAATSRIAFTMIDSIEGAGVNITIGDIYRCLRQEFDALSEEEARVRAAISEERAAHQAYLAAEYELLGRSNARLREERRVIRAQYSAAVFQERENAEDRRILVAQYGAAIVQEQVNAEEGRRLQKQTQQLQEERKELLEMKEEVMGHGRRLRRVPKMENLRRC